MSKINYSRTTSISCLILNIQVYINDTLKKLSIEINSDTHVGGLMLKIVDLIDIRHDWSDYALWWPLKNNWLLKTRTTLEQYGLSSNDTLEFTTIHKNLRLRLPSFQTICVRVDFSTKLFQTLIQLCNDINLKHAEEWSLLKINHFEHDIQNDDDYLNDDSFDTSQDTSQHGRISLNSDFKSSQASLSSENISINSTNLAYTTNANFNLQKYLKQMNIKYRSIYDKVYFNYFWLDSSKSLMEQKVHENDLLYLKLKYFNTFNLNNQIDNHVRINQIYEQAKYSILSEEIECTDEELIQFAGLQLQIQVQTKLASKVNTFSNHNLTQETNDIDAALDKLEKELKLNNTNLKTLFNDVPEIGEEIELMKPTKYTFKKFKIYYFQLKDTYLSYFKSKEDLLKKSKPLDKLNLKDSHLIPDLNIKSQKFCISLKVNDLIDDSAQELYLRFSTQQSYVKWVAAFKLASKNKTIADLDAYQFEIESINNLIEMQKKPSSSIQSHGTLDTNLNDFQPRNFVTNRLFKKMKTKQLTDRIIEAHSNLTHLDLFQAKLNYIRAWQALPDYGIVYFLVKIFPYNKHPKEVLGITSHGLVLFNSESVKIKKWSFNNMKTWLVNWETYEFDIEFDNERLHFACLNQLNPKIIHEFIGGYIYMSMRASDNHIDTQMFYNLTDQR